MPLRGTGESGIRGHEGFRAVTPAVAQAKVSSIGAFVHTWRTSYDIRLKDVGTLIGMWVANLCDIENGRKGVSSEKAEQMGRRPSACLQHSWFGYRLSVIGYRSRRAGVLQGSSTKVEAKLRRLEAE
jgi:hypothetical protein